MLKSPKSDAAAASTYDVARQRFEIIGTSPLLLHNGLLADAQGETAMAMRDITGKRSKTSADLDELARQEWFGGLYVVDGQPVIPADNVLRCLWDAAKKTKEGPKVKEGVFITGAFPIRHNGPKTLDKLYGDKRFVHQAMVRNVSTGARVKRTRPMFPQWSISFDVEFFDDIIDRATLKQIVETAGVRVGLGDWRPRYGRFAIS